MTTVQKSALNDLPVNPFEALRVSYGMLLGEDDFRTMLGSPRGKLMLHSAWLHGPGVVWGFPVDHSDDDELRVGPGLAIDGHGRELARHSPACLDVASWLTEQLRKGGEDIGTPVPCPPDTTRNACLVVRFDPCATRPVPALADPCDLQRTSTEFSRVLETASLELRADRCPPPPDPGHYHGVRVLLGLEQVGTAGDDKVGREARQALDDVLRRPPAERPAALLAAFRRILARDVTAMTPGRLGGEPAPGTFPVPDDDGLAVPLAAVQVRRRGGVVEWDADPWVRPGLVSTATIQELACALAPGLLEVDGGPRTGGPRVIRRSVRWSNGDRHLSFDVTKPLRPSSLTRGPVTVTSVGEGGWVREDLEGLHYKHPTVHVNLQDEPTYRLVRLIVKGTGPTPVLGTDNWPLAGLDDGPPGTWDDGHDAVLQLERRTR